MNTELLGILLMFFAALLLAFPLGRYMAKVYAGKPTLLDPVLAPLESAFFRLGGINPKYEMNWREYLSALLLLNIVWLLWCMFVLVNQGWLPLNPDGNPSMTPDLAFNTAISFLVNCNLQHYSGETGATYFSQLFCLMFMQFVSAGTGMAAAVAMFRAMQSREAAGLGNFWNDFLKSCTRVLLPLSLVLAVLLMLEGVPMRFEGKVAQVGLQGDTVAVSHGPVAAMVAIKQLGTNGGGFFGVNSAHPLENPTYFTNVLENIAILLIPMALVFALGHYLNKPRLSLMIFGVMTLGFLCLLLPALMSESGGNPMLDRMGVAQHTGSMEGKEVRLGAMASAYWGVSTTVTSNGSVNSMHGSHMPLSGAMQMLGMMINALYGGVGVGLLNFYVFMLLAVFISGLMVGRTPELLGKKVEAKEMKIAMIVALLHPLLILAGTALASHLVAANANMGWWFADAQGKGLPAGNWLNNPSFRGFGEMLYEYTSASANNGSGFEGLADNNPFWNISTGIVLILSRYIPIVGPVAIAGLLAAKKYIPQSEGTLPTDTATFGIVVFVVIVVVAALSFFPALALGPLAEFFEITY